MRLNVLISACLIVATGALVSGCQNSSDLTHPFDRETAVSEPSPEFQAALRAAIESGEPDAAPSKASTDAAMSSGGVKGITGPTVIKKPGFYRVTADFAASGDGIVVLSDWVWLDLGHHTITGPGNKTGTGIVLDNVKNVLVTRGTLQTFGVGVMLAGSDHSGVIGVDVAGGDEFADPANGIPPQIGVLLVNSSYNHVRKNHLEGINLGLFVRGGGSSHNQIVRNSAVAGDNGLLGICYNPAPDEGPAGPQSDNVRDNFLCRFGGGIQTSAESTNNRFSFNTIRFLGFAYEDFNGSNVFNHNDTTQIMPGDSCD